MKVCMNANANKRSTAWISERGDTGMLEGKHAPLGPALVEWKPDRITGQSFKPQDTLYSTF